MKKIRMHRKLRAGTLSVLLMLVIALAFALTGCGEKKEEVGIDNKEVFEEILTPISETELDELEDDSPEGEEVAAVSEEEMLELTGSENGEDEVFEDPFASEVLAAEPDEDQDGELTVEEDGTYTSKDEVALYIHEFGCLPSNFITKKEAKKLGWESSKGNLNDVAPGKSIGGDHFGNYEGKLPDKKGRSYTECDINYEGGRRGAERIIFSDDGLIFYTDDHYNTFEQLY